MWAVRSGKAITSLLMFLCAVTYSNLKRQLLVGRNGSSVIIDGNHAVPSQVPIRTLSSRLLSLDGLLLDDLQSTHQTSYSSQFCTDQLLCTQAQDFQEGLDRSSASPV